MFRKRVALGLVAVAILALVSGVYAYWRQSNPAQSARATSTVTSYPLELRMELNQTEFREGELIEVHVYIKNISNRTVELTAWKGWYDFNITDLGGNVVYQWTRYHIFTGSIPKILKSNTALNASQESKIFDEQTISMVPLHLSKGTYKILEFTPPLIVAYVEPLESVGELILETPPVTVTVN